MSLSQPEVAMQKLCEQAMEFVSHQGLDPGAFRRLSPFNDWSRNQPFQLLESFPAALVALRELPHFDSRFGANSASNFALQFIFNFLGASTTARFDRAPFEKVWGDLISELAEPNWVYFSICNLANFTSPCDLLPIGDGIQIRSRNFAEISKLLGWTDQTIDATLGRDWDEGGVGNHVLISESRLPKHADNLALVNDVGSITKLDQILVAMRLLKPGFVCPGRIFFARKSIFRYGLGGRSSSGYSRWNPGSKYELLEADL